MKHSQFQHIQTWIFDLDHTLYPPSMRLFDQIETRMTDWVVQELGVTREKADALRNQYWAQYGTTLAGLMREHDMAPEAYLAHVHDISFAPLQPDPILAERIQQLPGRKIIYTNGTAPYARAVASARGLDGVFDAVYGIEHAGFLPKPEAAAFERIFELDGLSPSAAAMFEDDQRNLRVPHMHGMQTIHVAPQASPFEHIHHHTPDLGTFLGFLLNA